MSRNAIEASPPIRPAGSSEPPPEKPLTADLDLLAQWMDSALEIPGIGVRFGLDAILGLIPGVGDAASAVVSLYIIRRAQHFGVGRATLLRMSLNVAGDMILGSVPVVGDVFDVFWKSNQRNVALIRRHALATPRESRRLRLSDRLFVAGILVSVAALAIASVVAAYFILAWSVGLARQFFG